MTLESFPITRLQAHAAVRLDDVPARCYDDCGFPVYNTAPLRKHGASLTRHLRRFALSIRSRIQFMFHECSIAVIESETALMFEARSMATARSAAGTERAVFAAPLAALRDVAADDVDMTGQVVGAMKETRSATARNDCPLSKRTPSHQRMLRQQELRSRLFGGDYGDVSLTLTFHVPKPDTDGRPCTSPYTRVNLRFNTAEERRVWTAYFRDSYIGLLLDSIRNGRGIENDAFAASQRQPYSGTDISLTLTPEMLEGYVTFFLSGVDHGSFTTAALSDTDPGEPPCKGLLRIGSHSGHKGRLCRLVVRPSSTTSEGTSCCATGGWLLVQDVSFSHRWRRLPEARLPMRDLRVCVDDSKGMFSSTFFLECTLLGSSDESYSRSLRARGATVVPLLPPLVDAAPPSGQIVTIECDAGSIIDRGRWLAWLEQLLGQPPLYMTGLDAHKPTTAGL